MEQQICPACKHEHIIGEAICRICKFPFNGTEKEKSIHIGRFISKKGVIEDSKNSLDKSRNWLFFVAALNILGIIINHKLVFYNIIVAAVTLAIPLIIITSALLLKKSPIVFLSIPLVLMLIVYTLELILEPSSWYRGIILKVFIIGLLCYSIYNYIVSKRFKKQYNQ